jgi:hypothetical protein
MQMTNADITVCRYSERGFFIHYSDMTGSLQLQATCYSKEAVDLIVLGAAAKGLSVYDLDRKMFLTGDVGQLAGEPAQ